MILKLIKKGFNYSQDGPGNRLVYHLQGCNMKCIWCANPESIPINGILMTNNEENFEAKISYFEMSVEEILEEVIKSKMLFFDGGGVTFSGGEPTMQFAELKDILKQLKKLHIHTTIETNGTHERLEELFSLIDVLIMDFKHIDNQLHEKFTGISNDRVKNNIKKAFTKHKNLIIRTPLIKNINDSKKTAMEFIAFYKENNTDNAQYEFLKYHEYGKAKWKSINQEYKIKEGYISDETLNMYKELFEKNNLKIIST